MQYSHEHLKTIVYAEFEGASRVYYGEFENREYGRLRVQNRLFQAWTDDMTIRALLDQARKGRYLYFLYTSTGTHTAYLQIYKWILNALKSQI